MITAVATQTRYTPEDLLAMPDGKNYELVDGQLVERKMGVESSWVAGRVTFPDRPLLRGTLTRMGFVARHWLSLLPSNPRARSQA